MFSVKTVGSLQNPLILDAFILKLTTSPPYAVITLSELNPSTYCCDDSIYVSFNVTNDLYQDNNFIVQLSDTSGNFISPINLDTLASNTSVQNFAIKLSANQLLFRANIKLIYCPHRQYYIVLLL